jgi:hypothetical protein
VRDIVGLGEVYASRHPGETKVISLEVPETSIAGKTGFFAVTSFRASPRNPSWNCRTS